MARLEVEDENYAVCRQAIGVLQHQTILSKEVTKMITQLEKFTSRVQPDIISIFRVRSDLPEDVIRGLKDLVNHKSLEVREIAAWTLRQQPILPRDVLEAVIRQLEDRDEAKIRAAVGIMDRGRTLDGELIDLIIDCSRDKYPSTRKAAVDVLGRQQDLLPAAVDALKALVEDTDVNVGDAAIEVLKKHRIPLA
ncbi:hypothetical protein PFICI_00345 [Pestalotiopsis fici W106-1]|uniref:HEAT repeat domain-containing protein n=1 Tax=Pestalotiopsis fici (strain W106-1 / CGMCC3.15140) TaxID=1229662 RepID=W3XM06_PESFW|nr:uncharacterized protein PFICI_00345 [Pestalotiopsis fici W106-1]ETS86517.1 hypothetical protein PFICI_00345 [Pestalotiopsis fici W106-1]